MEALLHRRRRHDQPRVVALPGAEPRTARKRWIAGTNIEPGVKAGLAATRNGRIGVIGTEATIATGAYEREFGKRSDDVELISKACPKFVDFVEAGDTTSDAVFAAAVEYLTPLKEAGWRSGR